jgi:putative transposase
VALTESDLSELLAALKAGEVTDTIRSSLEWVLQQLIEAEATAVIGAAPRERSETRTAQRNGHRLRLLSTPAGDVELEIPKLRRGSFFPSLLERRRRIDRALFAVVMEAYVHGVVPSVRGAGSGISKSEVSRICAELDRDLTAFRDRPLDHTRFVYVFLDATYVKGRVRGRVVSRAVVIATGVTSTGDREVLGVDVGDSEDGAASCQHRRLALGAAEPLFVVAGSTCDFAPPAGPGWAPPCGCRAAIAATRAGTSWRDRGASWWREGARNGSRWHR